MLNKGERERGRRNIRTVHNERWEGIPDGTFEACERNKIQLETCSGGTSHYERHINVAILLFASLLRL